MAARIELENEAKLKCQTNRLKQAWSTSATPQGKSWEDDTHRSLRRSRTFAWLLTGVFGVIALLSLVALVLLFPLKQYEPYMVAVDKTTGYLEIARALKPGDLSQDEAVTAANIVRYIRARETYDPRMIKSNFDLAQLYSTGAAADDLVREFTPSNPNSKDKRLRDRHDHQRHGEVGVVPQSHDSNGPPFDRRETAEHDAA